MSFPRRRWPIRLGLGAVNVGAQVAALGVPHLGAPAREALVAAAERRGLALVARADGRIWQVGRPLERPGMSRAGSAAGTIGPWP